MAIPLIDKNRVPYEGSTTFRADASYVWSVLPDVIIGLNSTIETINGNAVQVASDTTKTREYRDEVVVLRNDAVQAKTVIESYVIPTEATLSELAINDLVNTHRLENFLGFNF